MGVFIEARRIFRCGAGSSLWLVGFPLAVVHRFLSRCGAQAPGCVGSVVCGTQALLLRHASSVVVARGLSCPTACGILAP